LTDQVFYACAALGTLFLVVFSLVASNSPATNRFVSETERQYIHMDVNRYQYDKRSVSDISFISFNVRL